MQPNTHARYDQLPSARTTLIKTWGLLILLFITSACSGKSGAGLPYHEPEGPIVHHDLHLKWKDRPDPHLLITDRLFLKKAEGEGERITFQLHPDARDVGISWEEQELEFTSVREGSQVRHAFIRPKRAKSVQVSYKLTLLPDANTPGEISKQGLYLPASTHWHPFRSGEKATLRWQMVLPRTWLIAGPGSMASRTQEGTWQQTQWQSDSALEALDLIAGPFQFKRIEGEGKSPTVDGFFLNKNNHLAHAWTFACNRQLEYLRGLVGDFPSKTFRIIELPGRMQWARRWTMPAASIVSTELLQNASPDQIVASAILRSYWGSSKIPETDGDWRAAAEAYLTANAPSTDNKPPTDYEQRDAWLRHWGGDDAPENTQPLSAPAQNTPARTGRGAMVLHQLRRWVGSEKFNKSMSRLIASQSADMASWTALQRAFEREIDRPLGWFFEPWLQRLGAPKLTLAGAELTELQSEDGQRLAAIKVTIQRDGLRVPLRVPIVVDLDIGRISRDITVDEYEVTAYIPLQPPPDNQREDFLELGQDPPSQFTPFSKASANYALGGSMPGQRKPKAEGVRLDPNFEVLRELWPEEWLPRVSEIFSDDDVPVLIQPGSSLEKVQKHLAERLARDSVSIDEMRYGRHSTIVVANWSSVEESTLYLDSLEVSLPPSLFHRAGTVWHRYKETSEDAETTADRYKNYPSNKVSAALTVPHPKRAGYGLLIFLTHDEDRLMEGLPALSGAGKAGYLLIGGSQILARGRYQPQRHAMYQSLIEVEEDDGF